MVCMLMYEVFMKFKVSLFIHSLLYANEKIKGNKTSSPQVKLLPSFIQVTELQPGTGANPDHRGHEINDIQRCITPALPLKSG